MAVSDKKDFTGFQGSLKDLALLGGVLLVTAILSVLGVTDDLFGRLMRNSPADFSIALTLGVIGVALPVLGRLAVEVVQGREQQSYSTASEQEENT